MLRIYEQRQNPGANLRFSGSGKPPVIMQIIPALDGGGVEQGVIDTNAAVVAAGGISIVVSSGGRRAHEITRAGGRLVTCPVHSKNPFTMLRNIDRLKNIIRENGVDLVHAASRAPAWSARKAARDCGVRYVTSCHAAHRISGGFKRFYNSAIAKGERVITVSHFLSEYLQKEYGVEKDRIRVIHRGVSLEKFHPNSVSPDRLIQLSKKWRIPDDSPVILLPSRLTRGKGHLEAVAALSRMKKQDFFCVFVGRDQKGKFRPELEQSIESADLQSRVRIVDQCDDMPAAYMLASVIICPTTQPEGFGRVPIEAQAMGRPVIASDHGGFQETIRSGETGWLVSPGDDEALALVLEAALSLDTRQRAVLATQAMAHIAEHFLNEKMCRETLEVYAELLGISLLYSAPAAHDFPSHNDSGTRRITHQPLVGNL
ncbi:MAG: glycosyltransferase [Micavibrio sp.]|nr:MAG: glycosyltransferase [Micavibrio sp.]